ncbi:hypothetical protein GmRootV116_10360 [Variovorax sp. V116]
MSVVPHRGQKWTCTCLELLSDLCEYLAIGSPENWTASTGYIDSAYEVEPVTRWQNLQWHCKVRMGSPRATKRTAPHRHPPSRRVVTPIASCANAADKVPWDAMPGSQSCCRRIFSIFLPFASSSTSLSR